MFTKVFRAGLIACASAYGAAHGQVLVQPVVVEFAPTQRLVAVTLTMSERAAAPMRLQAQVLHWQQNADGSPTTEPASDIIVSPVIADLQPGKRQIFRVALRGTTRQREERAYRLVLEDIAEPPLDASGKPEPGVHIHMRYDLPLLVAGSAPAAPALRWQQCESAAASDLCVRLANEGTLRTKLVSIHVEGDGWSQDIPVTDGTLLARNQREWRAPASSRPAGPIRQVQARTAAGTTLTVQPPAS